LLGRSLKSEPKVIIPYTAPSWTTVATGVNPGKHGIFDFIKPLPNGEIGVVKSNEVMYPRINEVLALNNLPSITFNLIYSYPPLPKKENTLVVASWAFPKPKAWPFDVAKFIKKISGGWPPLRASTIEAYVDKIVFSLEKKINVQLEIAEKYGWKLCFTVFHEPDWVFHRAYREVLEGHKFRSALKVFRLIDSYLKKLYEIANAETMIILASDHGFMEVKNFINVNLALKKAGFLTISRPQGLRAVLFKTILEIFQRLPHAKHKLKYKALQFMELLNFKVGFGRDPLTSPIDYRESVAYMASLYYIYVNRRLNETNRIAVREKIISSLSSIKEYFTVVMPGNEFFRGPYARRAPDIVLIPREGFTVSPRLLSKKIVDRGMWYVHSPNGLATIYVPNLTADKNVEITQLDLVPTALAYLDLPVPHDADGHVVNTVRHVCENIKQKDYASIYRNLREIHNRIKRFTHKRRIKA